MRSTGTEVCKKGMIPTTFQIRCIVDSNREAVAREWCAGNRDRESTAEDQHHKCIRKQSAA